jgi:hypothetical protein
MLTKRKVRSYVLRPYITRTNSTLTVVLEREHNKYNRHAITNLMLFRLAINLADGDYVNQV